MYGTTKRKRQQQKNKWSPSYIITWGHSSTLWIDFIHDLKLVCLICSPNTELIMKKKWISGWTFLLCDCCCAGSFDERPFFIVSQSNQKCMWWMCFVRKTLTFLIEFIYKSTSLFFLSVSSFIVFTCLSFPT